MNDHDLYIFSRALLIAAFFLFGMTVLLTDSSFKAITAGLLFLAAIALMVHVAIKMSSWEKEEPK